MSNELSAISLPPGGFGSPVLPCYSSDLPSARQTQDDDILAGCPSGQWERTVNPSALPSKVRILHLPRRGPVTRDKRCHGPFSDGESGPELGPVSRSAALGEGELPVAAVCVLL